MTSLEILKKAIKKEGRHLLGVCYMFMAIVVAVSH